MLVKLKARELIARANNLTNQIETHVTAYADTILNTSAISSCTKLDGKIHNETGYKIIMTNGSAFFMEEKDFIKKLVDHQ